MKFDISTAWNTPCKFENDDVASFLFSISSVACVAKADDDDDEENTWDDDDEDEDDDFELTLRPTPDFYTPLLSRGPLIKVLSPQWLADEIKRQHLEAAKLYED